MRLFAHKSSYPGEGKKIDKERIRFVMLSFHLYLTNINRSERIWKNRRVSWSDENSCDLHVYLGSWFLNTKRLDEWSEIA